jgi:hypothetical protein
MDAAKTKREARLRRRLLSILENSAALEFVSGNMICDVLESSTDMQDELDCEVSTINEVIVRLARDLVNSGLAVLHDRRTIKAMRPSLDNQAWSITAKGTALLAGAIPVEPLVDDERI